ncbi:MAG: aspartate--ammonia ligase [Candidatus Babeliales bacterium]
MKLFSLARPYTSILDKRETERALVLIKSFFESSLAQKLNLMRVTAPLFVRPGTGINDDLNGVERPVLFPVKDDQESPAVIVHSLAKWKRIALATYQCTRGEGLYTDMKAIRADEELDNTHSLYVDQWDWEMAIAPEDRTLDFLKMIVEQIYQAMRATETALITRYPQLTAMLPQAIYFVHTEELAAMYPSLTAKEREREVCKKYGAVFLIGIGGVLQDGRAHDGRAPDYDDWSTPTMDGFKGLNGDILIWNPVLDDAFELSSMGIRVDKTALIHQLLEQGKGDRLSLMFHSMVLSGKIPLSIGGGIGQSRLCMLLLGKAHIGEVQASLWPEMMMAECAQKNIYLL